MSPKVKSSLYFASFMLAIITYCSVTMNTTIPNAEMAQNTIEEVAALKASH